MLLDFSYLVSEEVSRPALLSQAADGGTSSIRETLVVGECVVYSSSTDPRSTPYNFNPTGVAIRSLQRFLGLQVPGFPDYASIRADSTIVSGPQHGDLLQNKMPNGATFDYRSNIDYLGKENFTVAVKITGYPVVKVVYKLTIVRGGPSDEQIAKYCGTTAPQPWQISFG